MKSQRDDLKQTETDLENTLAQYSDYLEKLIETEEGGTLLNEDNTAFVAKEVLKEAKSLVKHKAKYAEGTVEHIVVSVDALMTKEKKLKKAVKEKAEALHSLTKEVIENLADEDVLFLLTQKWIVPLCRSLDELPDSIINELVGKTKALAEKYAVTYVDLEHEIRDAEQSLSALIDQLDGNEFDMKGLQEFQNLLGADSDGKE